MQIRRKRTTVAIVGAILALSGCSDVGTVEDNGHLICVGKHVVTAEDFNDAFEITKVAYPHNMVQDPGVLRKMRLRLFDQLVEEMVLSERAEVLGIIVSDDEVERAIAGVKADYPEGTFRQTLLGTAIAFSSWKKRLKMRMLIEKVVHKDLTERVEISADDVAQYYAKGQQGIDGHLFPEELDRIDETTVDRFRREKAEEAYSGWMESLKQAHAVEVNQVLWEELSGG